MRHRVCATLGSALGNYLCTGRRRQAGADQEQFERDLPYYRVARLMWLDLPLHRGAIELVETELNAVRDQPARCGTYTDTNAHRIGLQIVEFWVQFFIPFGLLNSLASRSLFPFCFVGIPFLDESNLQTYLPRFRIARCELTDEHIRDNYRTWRNLLEYPHLFLNLLPSSVLLDSSVNELLCEMRLEADKAALRRRRLVGLARSNDRNWQSCQLPPSAMLN